MSARRAALLAAAAVIAAGTAVAARPAGATPKSLPRVLTTVAGGMIGPVPAAEFRITPTDVAVDGQGRVFVSGQLGLSGVVVRLDHDGKVRRIAGTGAFAHKPATGVAVDSPLVSANALALDSTGDVFVADAGGNRVVKITPAGKMRLVAGTGTAGFNGDGVLAVHAMLHGPTGVAVDRDGTVYITDAGNQRIRKVDAHGVISTVARDAFTLEGIRDPSDVPAPPAGAGVPSFTGVDTQSAGHICVDAQHGVYLTGTTTGLVRMLAPDGTMTTVAGGEYARGAVADSGYTGDGGPALLAALLRPNDVAVGPQGVVYVTDPGHHRVRAIDAAGTITTVAGSGQVGDSGEGGPATDAALVGPAAVDVGPYGDLYVADGSRVLVVGHTDHHIHTVLGGDSGSYVGDGLAPSKAWVNPVGLATGPDGSLYVAERTDVRRIGPDGHIVTVAGGRQGDSGDGGPATEAAFTSITGIAVSPAGDVYIADLNAHRVRRVSSDGVITTFAGTGVTGSSGDGGPAAAATLDPEAVATDGTGDVFVADGHGIRRIDPTGTITTVAGNGAGGYSGDGGPADKAGLRANALVVAPDGDIYFSQVDNASVVRRIDATTGLISTVAGGAAPGYTGDGGPAAKATLGGPHGLALDRLGDLYVAEAGNHIVRLITASGRISTVAGTGTAGFDGDVREPATDSPLDQPLGVAVGDGVVYVADTLNQRIRTITSRGTAQLSLAASRPTARPGGRVSLRAGLSALGRPLANQTVELVHGATVTTARTDERGVAVFVDRPRRTTTYLVRWAGCGSIHSAASPPVVVRVVRG